MEASIGSDDVVARNPRVEYRKLAGDGGGVLLNLDTAAYHGVNRTGALIWECVGTGKRLRELIPEVAAHFTPAPPTIEADVAGFVDELVERDLLRRRDGSGSDA